MHSGVVQAHSTFRNQPSYTIFNKSFEDSNDVLFLQLNEIDPYFLNEAHQQDNGFLQDDLPDDPRTRRKVQCTTYDHTEQRKYCKLFKGACLKSILTKKQQDICLRVMLGWQERTPIDESDLIIWRQSQGKIKKEREQMQKFIAEYAEAHKEEMYAPCKRLDDYYRNWFKLKTKTLLQQHPENLTFNTYIGLPHVSICKSSNEEKPEMCNIQLLARTGWLRIHDEKEPIEWNNLNFRFEEYCDNFNAAINAVAEDNSVESQCLAELTNFEEQEIGRNCYMPFETILFLLAAGNYLDLRTECLLEISNVSSENKIVKFDIPFPSRNCGWHTQQQVVEQAFSAFLSAKGRARWLRVENKKVDAEVLETVEIHAVSVDAEQFKPQIFENYLSNEMNLRSNSALIKWHLQTPESEEYLKILTSLSLPPTMDERGEKFLAHETLKLEYKSQFGCELLTKYELLSVWLKMRLMKCSNSSDYGYCYRLSAIDCDLQLKEHLSIETVEHQLKNTYHINPEQLIANLAEFLKLLFNMPPGKYVLRYNAKYKDKLLLCSPSQEITQNTLYLHSLFQTEPTSMMFMTQPQYLPILETLCSRVHLRYRILPCAFLPQLPHQKNLQTAASRAKAQNIFLQKKLAAQELALNEEKMRAKNIASKRRRQKRWLQRKKKRNADAKELEQEEETKKLLEFL